MSIRLIVSDWNGTLFRPRSDLAFQSEVAKLLLAHRPSRFLARSSMVQMPKLFAAAMSYSLGAENALRTLYAIYNPIFAGVEPSIVDAAITRYAARTFNLLNMELLYALRVQRDRGVLNAILSLSFSRLILEILKRAASQELFDAGIVAHAISCDEGRSIFFSSEICGRKGEYFAQEFLDKRCIDPRDTVYIGDSASDEPVAKYLPPGHFFVSAWASRSFEQRMLKIYDAQSLRHATLKRCLQEL